MSKNKGIIFSNTPDNQLAVRIPPNNSQKLLKGEFRVDRANNLIYLVNEPDSWRRKYGIPNKIEFEGKWKLNTNYDLSLDIEEKEEQWRKRSLVLKGQILDCRENHLIFRIKSRLSPALTKVSLLKLKGNWKADKFNRIIFEVSKKEKPDILTFKGAWSLNKSQQIIYKYEKLKTKFRKTLVFKGFWDISRRNRLTYTLENLASRSRTSKHSEFDFRAYLGSPNIYPAEGKIKYRMGIGLSEQRKERTVTLYGEWKFSRKFGLIFETDYAGRIRRIQFAATVNLSRRDKVNFMLKDKNNKPLGIILTFKRRFLPKKDFEYFLRLRKESRNHSVELGGALSF